MAFAFRGALLAVLLVAALSAASAAVEEGTAGADLETLRRELAGEDGNARRRAAAALGRSGRPEALELLDRAYEAEAADAFGVKAAIAEALGDLRRPEAARPLSRILADPDYWVRRKAASALGQVPGAEAAQALVGALGDSDPRVRVEALRALGGHPGETPRVIRALGDPDPRMVEAAVDALDAADAPEAREALGRSLASRDASLRLHAAALLVRRGDVRGLRALELGLRAPETARTALREAGKAGCGAVPALASYLPQAGEADRQLLLGVLEEQPCAAATEALLEQAVCAACSGSDRVRAAQALFDRRTGLGRTQSGRVAALLSAQDPDLVALALQILLDADGGPPLERMAPLAFHGNQVVRHFALANLSKFGGPDQEETLVRALSDANGSNIRLALEGLGRVGGEAALAAIRPLAQDRLYRRAAEAAIEAIEGRR